MKRLKLGVMVTVALTLLAACQSQPSQTTTYQTLPEVTAKYNADDLATFNNRRSQGQTNRYENLTIPAGKLLNTPENLPKTLFYDSGININYPKDGVKGIYLTAEIAGNPTKLKEMIDYLKRNKLNSVVIDFKDDYGQIVTPINSQNNLVMDNVVKIADLKEAVKTLAANNIYPIARIVTFKDNLLAQERPDLSFHDKASNQIWMDGNGAKFINPYLEEVWRYNVDVAIEAAKIGFKEIQFDYVRFPEGFETFADDLKFDKGSYANYVGAQGDKVEGQDRVAAILDFLNYAKEGLAPYGVKVGADVFGITAVTSGKSETTGIGQDFPKMAETLDVISSMVYPSHWGNAFFGIEFPDLHPYDVIDEYMYSEKSVLKGIPTTVTSRPWLQDFTDYSKAEGTFQEYSTEQVQDQIDALAKHNIHEFLLWNANGQYSEGLDVTGGTTSNSTN